MKYGLIILLIWFIVFLLLFLTMGCASGSLNYFDRVRITSGQYKDETGILVEDCSGFENYKVRLNRIDVCVHSWNMEKIN